MADFYILLVQFLLFLVAVFFVSLLVMLITYLSRIFIKIRHNRRVKRLFYDEGDL